MDNQDLKTKLIGIYEDVVSADEYGNDHNDRKETREKFDNIIEQLKKLCGGECSNENSKLNMQSVNKRAFCFDYIGKTYNDAEGRRVGEMKQDYIEAYDEEHAILLFKERHPDTPFDPPY